MARPDGIDPSIDTATLASNDAVIRRSHGPPSFPPGLLEAALARVVASGTFRRSQRHRDFLEHIVRAAVDGRHELLKEFVIGLEVFRRPIDRYDPRRDPIVRVEAARIREKLVRFYASEGAAEPFEIVVPVGAYLPRLQRRAAAPIDRHPLDSLAVLPFENLSASADDDAFRLGLTDLLIDMLSRVRGLKVVARVSALKAREGNVDPRATGRMLGVAHLVEGSIQRSGTRLRCFAHITRIADSTQVWSHRFDLDDAKPESTFPLQDEIAHTVLAAVDAAVDGADHIVDPGQPTSRKALASNNEQARTFLDRARTLIQQRSYESYERAIVLLEKAIALDPHFARAHTYLAIALGNFVGFTSGPTASMLERIRSACDHALRLDPLDGEATSVLAAATCRFDYDWARADALYRRGIELSPSSPYAHATYAWGLSFQGRFDEAVAHIDIALDLDPLNLGTRVNRAFVHTYARRYATAITEFNAILELEPQHLMSHVQLGLTHLWIGQSTLATQHFDAAFAIWASHPLVRLCRIAALAQHGDRDRAVEDLDHFLAVFGDGPFSRFTLAMVYACLDDGERCVSALEAAAVHKDFNFASVSILPLFDRFRSRPDYQALQKRYRLGSFDVVAAPSVSQ